MANVVIAMLNLFKYFTFFEVFATIKKLYKKINNLIFNSYQSKDTYFLHLMYNFEVFKRSSYRKILLKQIFSSLFFTIISVYFLSKIFIVTKIFINLKLSKRFWLIVTPLVINRKTWFILSSIDRPVRKTFELYHISISSIQNGGSHSKKNVDHAMTVKINLKVKVSVKCPLSNFNFCI